MTTVTMKEFYEDLRKFYNKHLELHTETSPLVNNSYHKEYYAEDGATFYEVNDVVYEKVEIEVHGIKMTVEVKLRRTEYWSTDDSKSKYIYERF